MKEMNHNNLVILSEISEDFKNRKRLNFGIYNGSIQVALWDPSQSGTGPVFKHSWGDRINLELFLLKLKKLKNFAPDKEKVTTVFHEWKKDESGKNKLVPESEMTIGIDQNRKPFIGISNGRIKAKFAIALSDRVKFNEEGLSEKDLIEETVIAFHNALARFANVCLTTGPEKRNNNGQGGGGKTTDW